ncbi:hypothetical protein [Mesorhizobium sp. BAC0120]|uniref:hypothetical protein n=1 Tax=Mesorhizobium sp. BAC0120 TaxID=3090670 RepID=UPI00298C69DB|nr:hypothetical protein [Mesorhizobium sp. BAC0120]
MMNRFAFVLGALSCIALVGPAAAQAEHPTCGPRKEVVAKLAQDFKESQQSVGVVNAQALLEVFVSGAGTWTILATGTDGNSCILSAGKDWDSLNFVRGLDTKLQRPAAAVPSSR